MTLHSESKLEIRPSTTNFIFVPRSNSACKEPKIMFHSIQTVTRHEFDRMPQRPARGLCVATMQQGALTMAATSTLPCPLSVPLWTSTREPSLCSSTPRALAHGLLHLCCPFTLYLPVHPVAMAARGELELLLHCCCSWPCGCSSLAWPRLGVSKP